MSDLRFAQQACKAVEVRLYSQGTLGLVGVADVDEDGGWVSFKTPKTFGDETSRTRVELSDIATLQVTDIEF